MNNPLCEPVLRLEFRDQVMKLLGGTWPTPSSLDTEVLVKLDRGDHTAELIRYIVEPGDIVTAWLLRPNTDLNRANLRPAIAVWHQHNDEYHLGKSESAGFSGNPSQHTGLLLVREGYIVLCPDAAGFEDRSHSGMDGRAWERHLFSKQIWAGRSLAWKNILDCRAAIDFLVSLPDVDSTRLGCYGHSLGSTLSWLTAPWDDRLKCIVGNCCMPSIVSMRESEINHSFSNTIPGLESIGDIPDVVSLIAPRRLHLNFGAKDQFNPVGYIEKELPQIAEVYAATNASEAFTSWIDRDAGHELSAGMESRVLSVFRETLN